MAIPMSMMMKMMMCLLMFAIDCVVQYSTTNSLTPFQPVEVPASIDRG